MAVLGELVEELRADQVYLPEVRAVRVPASVITVADRRTAVRITLDAEAFEKPRLERGDLGEVVHGAHVDGGDMALAEQFDLPEPRLLHAPRVTSGR
jgi:hypothetical protein